jgi:hypothetical protein
MVNREGEAFRLGMSCDRVVSGAIRLASSMSRGSERACTKVAEGPGESMEDELG